MELEQEIKLCTDVTRLQKLALNLLAALPKETSGEIRLEPAEPVATEEGKVVSTKKRRLSGTTAPVPKKKRRRKAAFDFSKFRFVHIALKIAYFGEGLHGLTGTTIDDTIPTVESHLFHALEKTKLIADRALCELSRCGRTDKGVSAFCNVLSLKLRSSKLASLPLEDQTDVKDINYAYVINRVLPPTIRILGWAPVADDFSARFDCVSRKYRYFFVRKNMNIEAMKAAAKLMVGAHDFRNFCKMNAVEVRSFGREILSANVVRLDEFDCKDESFQVWYFEVSGTAFLWHMVRCLMAVLFMVGEGKEEPEVISALLDVEACPCKPSYTMANDLPLLLFDVVYEGLDFVCDCPEAIAETFQRHWNDCAIAAARSATMLANFLTLRSAVPADAPRGKARGGKHTALLHRSREPSLEEKVRRLSGKKKERFEDIERWREERGIGATEREK